MIGPTTVLFVVSSLHAMGLNSRKCISFTREAIGVLAIVHEIQ